MRLITLLIFTLIIGGCGGAEIAAKRGISFKNYSQDVYPARAEDAPVDLFFKDVPQKEYAVIGEINGTFSGDVNKILEAKARQVGGDGMIDIDVSSKIESTPDNLTVQTSSRPFETTPVFTPGYSYKTYTVKAKVIRYKD